MKCHYCGKEVWLVRHLLDGDFCSPVHRKKYHERLRRSLELLPHMEGPPAPKAGFRFEMPPADSRGGGQQRSLGFLASQFHEFAPLYALQVTPLFGQEFFGPSAATAAAPKTGSHAATMLEPVVSGPDVRSLGRCWTLAGGTGAGSRGRLLPLGTAHVDASIGPRAATAAALKAAMAPATWLEPVVSGPTVAALGRCWTLAVDTGVAPRGQLLRLRTVHVETGAPALPLCSPPIALVARAPHLVCPKLEVGGIFGSGLSGDTSFPLPKQIGDLRNVPLASWTRANLAPISGTGKAAGTPAVLPHAAASIATRNGSALHLARCAPANFAAPLLAQDAVASGTMSPAEVTTAPIETRTAARLPAFLAGPTAGLAAIDKGIWKISPASPWSLATPAAAHPIASALSGTVLPAISLAPVRPGLAAEWEIRPMAAQALEMPAAAAHNRKDAGLDAPERPAVPPTLAVPVFVPALSGAFAPHLFQAAQMTAHDRAAVPSSAGEEPLVRAFGGLDPMREGSLAPALEICGGAAAVPRPRAAEGIAPAMPVFVPQAAVPRRAAELCVSGPRLDAAAIPAATPAGFHRRPFAGLPPQPLERRLQPRAIEATPIVQNRMSLREPVIPITGIGLPQPLGVVPLDVYVQRVRSAPKRECAPKDLGVRRVPPTAMPGVWPARFEQLVLQDWRRRYPARQLSMSPAPVGTAKVLPISAHLSGLARLRQNAPHFVKGVAAAAVVGAILWFSWSTEGVRSAVATDRHWVRDTIARRATLVHNDSFHSGLDLWEGRKNWASSWSYSPDGFMRTGQLALYRPTLKMDDYRLEFFTQIESKSVGWVFRAKDEKNYYAMKLSVTEPGPRPLVSVVRYPVLEGRKGKRVQTPLPLMMHNNTPYHVAIDVKGSRFRAFVEDQEVDSWTDNRLRAGGVGFFSEAGEHARLYWVKVSKNSDWLGRLCGFLAGSGAGQDSADMWNPAGPDGSMAAVDPASILNAAKNVDMKRGVPTLPFATVFLGNSL